jgi:hypothetical protein
VAPRAAAAPAPAATEEARSSTSTLEPRLSRLERSLEELDARLGSSLEELRKRLDEALRARETAPVVAAPVEATPQVDESVRQLEHDERVAALGKLAAAPASTNAAPQTSAKGSPESPAAAADASSETKGTPAHGGPKAAKPIVMPIYRAESAEPPSLGFVSFLFKLTLVVAVAVGVYFKWRDIQATINKWINMPKVAATQATMAGVLSMVEVDSADGSLPAPEEFTAYLKSHAAANADHAASDGWGTDLRLDRSPDAIRSAGPDRIFDTDDDLVVPIAKHEAMK